MKQIKVVSLEKFNQLLDKNREYVNLGSEPSSFGFPLSLKKIINIIETI
jgi:hypothetical protein